MPANPCSKWFWNDWDNDMALHLCSLAAQGLWMRMLSIAARATPIGYVMINGRSVDATDLAHVTGASEAEIRCLLDELEDRRVFSRDRHRRIYNRRMVRDARDHQSAVRNGKDGGNPLLRRGSVPKDQRVRPFRRSDNPAKTLRIFKAGGGRCHWCACELVFESDTLVPNLFHVDHLLPIADGGTNADSNLVSACALCNHARARIDWLNPSDTNPDIKPPLPLFPIPESHKEDSPQRTTSVAPPQGGDGPANDKKANGHDRSRGTRLPADWEPDDDLREFAAKLIGADAVSDAIEEFRDYWCAVAGARARKADWSRTFKNSCRKLAERSGSSRSWQPGGSKPNGSSLLEAARIALGKPSVH